MNLTPEQANSRYIPSGLSFDEIKFFEGVLKNDYILVLGSGVILDRKKFPEYNGDINNWILAQLNQRSVYKYSSISDAVSAMSESHVYDILANNKYKIEDVSEELTNILKLGYFKFVFTTTPDLYIEKILLGIWGNELRIVNFSDDASLESFNNALKKYGIEGYEQPTLFYVFGRFKKGQRELMKFLITDNASIEYIEKWLIKFNDDTPLIRFLKSKRLFGVGCNFDDWYYRFFWHILTRDFINREKVAPYKSDNAVLESNSFGLANYLNKLKVSVHNDSWSVLSYLYHMLSAKNGEIAFRDLIDQKKLEGKVFISYKSNPDSDIAKSLFKSLSERNSFKVWFDDSSLLGGQKYNCKIPEAIRFSKVFIPILTSSVADILNNWTLDELLSKDINDGLPYFLQEWKWAKHVDGLEIIPVAFDGYDLKGPEHEKFVHFVFDDEEDHPSGINMGSGDSLDGSALDKLVVSLRFALGIYE